MTIHLPSPKPSKPRTRASKKNAALPAPDTCRNGKRVSNLPTLAERLAAKK
ncbi:MAG TPA: hypothetical protein VH253_02010 [Phycisphaerae bacterium]|nr:hypothetical protein [Phycisphaerae bacterium]